MKIKWGKRSLTFMIIPDANSRVLRFRVSSVLLYLIPILLLSVLCVTLYVHMNSLQNKLAKQQLASELANKTAAYEQSLSIKDSTIEQLQDEILDISLQTEEVKVKVEELEKLEAEINSITGNGPEEGQPEAGKQANAGQTGAAKNGVVSIASVGQPEIRSLAHGDHGVGGVEQRVTSADTDKLVAFTKEQLALLEAQTSALLTDISVAKEDLIEHLRMLRITPSIWPTDSRRITSAFGYRKDPFTRKASLHEGIDFGADSGSPVYATADGVVTHVGYDGGHGYNVIIKHASGVSTRYSHLKKYLVKDGQKVEQGETIGQVGSTGRSTGPHLHYEIIKSGDSIDPMPYLETAGGDDN